MHILAGFKWQNIMFCSIIRNVFCVYIFFNEIQGKGVNVFGSVVLSTVLCCRRLDNTVYYRRCGLDSRDSNYDKARFFCSLSYPLWGPMHWVSCTLSPEIKQPKLRAELYLSSLIRLETTKNVFWNDWFRVLLSCLGALWGNFPEPVYPTNYAYVSYFHLLRDEEINKTRRLSGRDWRSTRWRVSPAVNKALPGLLLPSQRKWRTVAIVAIYSRVHFCNLGHGCCLGAKKRYCILWYCSLFLWATK